jgi:hypothetical protein
MARAPGVLAVLAFLHGTAAAAPEVELARDEAVCDRLVDALDAEPPKKRLRKAWIAVWDEDEAPDDLRKAVAPHVTRIIGERSGMLLVLGTKRQLDRVSHKAPVYAQYADELDHVECGSLGFTAAPTGAVRPTVSLPAIWRGDDTAAEVATYHCIQVWAPEDGDHDEALARAIGRDDLSLVCDATCVLPLTAAQADAVGRLPFVRGVWRRAPAFTLDSSLVCDTGSLPVSPAEWPAFLAAVVANPDEEITVGVTVDDEVRLGEIKAAMGKRARDARGGGLVVTLRRGDLPALAALPAVWSIERRTFF